MNGDLRLQEIDRELTRLQDVIARAQRKHENLVQERRRIFLRQLELFDPED